MCWEGGEAPCRADTLPLTKHKQGRVHECKELHGHGLRFFCRRKVANRVTVGCVSHTQRTWGFEDFSGASNTAGQLALGAAKTADCGHPVRLAASPPRPARPPPICNRFPQFWWLRTLACCRAQVCWFHRSESCTASRTKPSCRLFCHKAPTRKRSASCGVDLCERRGRLNGLMCRRRRGLHAAGSSTPVMIGSSCASLVHRAGFGRR